MENTVSAPRVSRSDSTVKVINSFKELLTSVLGVLSTPLTIGVIVIVALIAFNDYERWTHRDLGPARTHELAVNRARSTSALELQILHACRGRTTQLWTCVGATKRQLTR